MTSTSEDLAIDVDSVGQAFDDLLRLLAKAEADGNLTAAANLMRQRLQAHGILRDRVAFTLEEQTSVVIAWGQGHRLGDLRSGSADDSSVRPLGRVERREE